MKSIWKIYLKTLQEFYKYLGLQTVYNLLWLLLIGIRFFIKISNLIELFFPDNYILSGTGPGQYMLFSPLQKENGPRLFDPFFGFAYMGKLASFRIIIFQNNVAQFDLTPSPNVRVGYMSWNYFSKNLSSLPFFSTSWNSGKEWQVIYK